MGLMDAFGGRDNFAMGLMGVGGAMSSAGRGGGFDLGNTASMLYHLKQKKAQEAKMRGLMEQMGYAPDSPQAEFAQNFPQFGAEMAGRQLFPQGGGPYTLGPGAIRFGGDNQPVAQGNPRDNNGISFTTPDGSTIQIGGSGGGAGFGTMGNNKLDEKILNSSDALARMTQIGESFRPEYLEIPTRMNFAWKELKDKWGELKPEDKAALGGYVEFRAKAVGNLSLTLKEISGTALSPGEFERITKNMPSAGTGIWDGDGPTSFEGKYQMVMRDTRLALARYNYMKSTGTTGDPTKLATLDGMEQFMRDKAKEVVNQLRAQYPDMPADQIGTQADYVVKQMFGL